MKKYFSLAVTALILAGCAAQSGKEKLSQKSLDYQKRTFFTNEIKPVDNKPCFAGAYYRKLVSSPDDWVGIEGTVVLPHIKFDQNRKNPKKPMQYMDNPSVYLGGNMDEQETDIGLTWEVVKDANGNETKDRRAFRPFLRRNNYKEVQKAVYEGAPAKPEFYWYPDEEVKISLKLVADKTLRLVVEGAGKKFERDFICDGFRLGGKAEYKRVNAIDQVRNEGKPVQTTETQVIGANWKETNLFRNVNNTVVTVPFHSGRYTEMMCPSSANFKVSHTDKQKAIGAETFTISGNGKF